MSDQRHACGLSHITVPIHRSGESCGLRSEGEAGGIWTLVSRLLFFMLSRRTAPVPQATDAQAVTPPMRPAIQIS